MATCGTMLNSSDTAERWKPDGVPYGLLTAMGADRVLRYDKVDLRPGLSSGPPAVLAALHVLRKRPNSRLPFTLPWTRPEGCRHLPSSGAVEPGGLCSGVVARVQLLGQHVRAAWAVG